MNFHLNSKTWAGKEILNGLGVFVWYCIASGISGDFLIVILFNF